MSIYTFVNEYFWILNAVSISVGFLAFLGVSIPFNKKRNLSKKMTTIIQVIIIALVTLVVSSCVYIQQTYPVVPNVKTLSLDSAKQELQRLGFNIECDQNTNDDNYTYKVISQEPEASICIKKGSTIKLYVEKNLISNNSIEKPNNSEGNDNSNINKDENKNNSELNASTNIPQDTLSIPLPKDGTSNVTFVGKGLDISNCKISYLTNNKSFEESILTNSFDGKWINAKFPKEEVYFCVWRDNELVGSSYGTINEDGTNNSIAIYPSKQIGLPTILKFEGKDNLNIMDCMITITLNDSTTLNKPIIESFNGEQILYFVKPGNYEIYCWRNNTLIAKNKWTFEDPWSIHTIYFYPLD